jgi:acyl-CoA synthetase (AMP-forming)/AMP-acid ligase II
MGSMPEPAFPIIEGKLLVTAIEEKAQWSPHHTWLRYAPVNWEKDGYNTITWQQYAKAIDKVAYWLDEQLGKATELDTVAYFGPNDPRYSILIPAGIKSGRKVVGIARFCCFWC